MKKSTSRSQFRLKYKYKVVTMLPVKLASAVLYKAILFGCFTSAHWGANAYPIGAKEYIPYHPTGCRYVRKESNGSFRFVQTCSRGTGGWQQDIMAMELATPGVIYIARQTLVNGIDLEGYWCSGIAPNAFKDRFQTCTKIGWQKSPGSP